MNKTQFPPGWDEARAKAVIADLESMTEDELAAEDDAAFDPEPGGYVMRVPAELVPAVRQMISKHRLQTADAVVSN